MRIWWVLLSLCSASVTTPYGLNLQWAIHPPAATFTLTMPAGMAQEYDYWGVGWKAEGAGKDMKQAEIWLITKTGQLLAYLSQENEGPQQGRQSSAVMVAFRNDGGNYEAIIVRELQTTNPNDIQFTESGNYLLIYAYGYLADDGSFSPHSADDSGAVSLVLTNDIPIIPADPNYPNSTSGSSLPAAGFETTETLPPATSASLAVALLTIVLVSMAFL